MAVVKADGYGHGLLPCARAAIAGGATWLGTAALDEEARAARRRLSGASACCPGSPRRGERYPEVRADVDSRQRVLGRGRGGHRRPYPSDR